jgi:hydrogenase-1 operon protein HyaE
MSPSTPAATESAAVRRALPSPIEGLHPLLARLVEKTGAALLDAEHFEAWAAEPGVAMVVFVEDPERYKETLDLAVIVPELHASRHGRFRVALLPPEAARVVVRRYGFAHWPAFVMLRDGRYLGAVDGIRDWDVYLAELDRLLVAAPSRPPTVGIPVSAAGASDASACH